MYNTKHQNLARLVRHKQAIVPQREQLKIAQIFGIFHTFITYL
jgi:hypothetical protein